MKAGDVVSLATDGKFSILKILRIESDPEKTHENEIFHCLVYVALDHEPRNEDLRTLKVLAWHAPIAGASIRNEGRVVANQLPSGEELSGFHDYLKRSDFSRYLQETNQRADEVIEQANSHYNRALALSEQKKWSEAIQEYSAAVSLFPLFFEAIDNRGFARMSLGDWTAALKDFEESLSVHPDGFAAFFSKGECHLKLDELDEAAHIFSEGLQRFPQHAEVLSQFLNKIRLKR